MAERGGNAHMCIYCKLFFTYIPTLFCRYKLILAIQNNSLAICSFPLILERTSVLTQRLQMSDYTAALGNSESTTPSGRSIFYLHFSERPRKLILLQITFRSKSTWRNPGQSGKWGCLDFMDLGRYGHLGASSLPEVLCVDDHSLIGSFQEACRAVVRVQD